MAEAHSPENEASELAERTRELNEAIASARARIRALQGLPDSEGKTSRWRRPFDVEAEHDLPPLDPEGAPGALVDALHRETGLLGAVSTRGTITEWKVLDPRIARRRLEVTLDAGAAPSLHMKDSASGAHGKAAGGAVMIGLMVPLVLALTFLNLGPVLTMLATLLLLAGFLAARNTANRRAGRHALRELAASLGESLPVEGSGVRVAVDDSEDGSEEGAEDEPVIDDEHERAEAARGLP